MGVLVPGDVLVIDNAKVHNADTIYDQLAAVAQAASFSIAYLY